MIPGNTTDLRVAAIHAHVSIFDVFARMGLDLPPETQQITCPFHADTAPSARVYADQNVLYCFSCQKRWDVIAAVQDHFKLGFTDALAFLEQEFAVPGGAAPTLAASIKTRLLRKAGPDIAAIAMGVETLLRSRKAALGFRRYTTLLQALDLTVAQAADHTLAPQAAASQLAAVAQAMRGGTP